MGTGSVEIGYAASPANKHKAIALNSGCLTRLRGCNNQEFVGRAGIAELGLNSQFADG